LTHAQNSRLTSCCTSPDDEQADGSYLYFIQAGESGPIKIGISRNPWARLRTLQTAHFAPLRMLAAVKPYRTAMLEAELHKHLHRLRLTGEWFDPAVRGLAEYAATVERDEAGVAENGVMDFAEEVAMILIARNYDAAARQVLGDNA
jgi:hypothetical protein